MARVTAHFDTREFACRDGTPYPERWREARLRPLCETLEILRSDLRGAAITILSGYRSEAYNRRVGGARASQHVQGRAADIVVRGWTPAEVHAVILALYAEGRLPHLGGLGYYPVGQFVHVDVRPGSRLARWEGGRSAAEVV